MYLLDRLKVGEVFNNFAELEKFFEELCDCHYYPLRVKNSKIIKTYSKSVKKQLDEKWVYKFVEIICSHFGSVSTWKNGKDCSVAVKSLIFSNE